MEKDYKNCWEYHVAFVTKNGRGRSQAINNFGQEDGQYFT